MKSLRQKALNAISTLSEEANIDEIMYRLYVIDQIEKGKSDVKFANTVLHDNLEKEIQTW